MKIFENIDLHKYSTMRLHSVADVMYVPQSRDELKKLICDLDEKHEKYYIVSAGSNTSSLSTSSEWVGALSVFFISILISGLFALCMKKWVEPQPK